MLHGTIPARITCYQALHAARPGAHRRRVLPPRPRRAGRSGGFDGDGSYLQAPRCESPLPAGGAETPAPRGLLPRLRAAWSCGAVPAEHDNARGVERVARGSRGHGPGRSRRSSAASCAAPIAAGRSPRPGRPCAAPGGHSYDIARQGYVALLPCPGRRCRRATRREMVAARHALPRPRSLLPRSRAPSRRPPGECCVAGQRTAAG